MLKGGSHQCMQAVFTVATDVVGMSSATQDSPVVGQPWYDHATASYGITLQVTDVSGEVL